MKRVCFPFIYSYRAGNAYKLRHNDKESKPVLHETGKEIRVWFQVTRLQIFFPNHF